MRLPFQSNLLRAKHRQPHLIQPRPFAVGPELRWRDFGVVILIFFERVIIIDSQVVFVLPALS